MGLHATAPPASLALAEYCRSLRWAGLDSVVRGRVVELLLDHLGVCAAGHAAPSTVAIRQYVRGSGETGASTVVAAGVRTSAASAALANGTAAHALELDDVERESSLHPGVSVIPAVVAAAEDARASPTRTLEAIIAGYEVTLRVGWALDAEAAYRRGFHPTGVAGAFGAAAGAALVRGGEVPTIAAALGLAGSMAAGSLEYLSTGAWTKRLNAGWAARAGVVAAGLAGAGYSAPASIFEGRLGVLGAYSDASDPARLVDGLGQDPPRLLRVAIKPYGCCRYIHGVIDAMLALRGRGGVEVDQVQRIELGILTAGSSLVATPIAQKRRPRSIVDAQFSAPFGAALALVVGHAGQADFNDATISDPRIVALMDRTSCFFDRELDAAYPARWPTRVVVHLKDGSVLEESVNHMLGEPENPVPRGVLMERFVDLAGSTLGADAAGSVGPRLLALDQETDLETVMAILRGPAYVDVAGDSVTADSSRAATSSSASRRT